MGGSPHVYYQPGIMVLNSFKTPSHLLSMTTMTSCRIVHTTRHQSCGFRLFSCPFLPISITNPLPPLIAPTFPHFFSYNPTHCTPPPFPHPCYYILDLVSRLLSFSSVSSPARGTSMQACFSKSNIHCFCLFLSWTLVLLILICVLGARFCICIFTSFSFSFFSF